MRHVFPGFRFKMAPHGAHSKAAAITGGREGVGGLGRRHARQWRRQAREEEGEQRKRKKREREGGGSGGRNYFDLCQVRLLYVVLPCCCYFRCCWYCFVWPLPLPAVFIVGDGHSLCLRFCYRCLVRFCRLSELDVAPNGVPFLF